MAWFDELLIFYQIPGFGLEWFSYPLTDLPSQVELSLEG